MTLHQVAQIVFWTSLAFVLFTYFVYPVILLVLYSVSQLVRDLRYLERRKERRVRAPESEGHPTVSIVIAAYNEEEVLEEKIQNMLQLDYPPELVECIVVSDGSDDRTPEILRGVKDARFRAIILTKRGGKSNALNVGIQAAKNEIVVLSDASTLFDSVALQKLARHFSDEKVGVVCGALQFKGSTESQQTEGVYWKYESMLRLMEARLGATLTASGAIYAIRRAPFRPIPPSTILDDLVIPMNMRRVGLRVVYDPEAIAFEVAAESVGQEFRRRVRIARGSFRALFDIALRPLDPMTLFAFLSHKLLRWLVPIFQILILLSNIVLLDTTYFAVFFVAQLFFYGWAAIGYLLRAKLQNVRFVLLPYFLTAMNLAFLIGLLKFLGGSNQSAAWDRAR